ncbi:hypothetical protein DPMN_053462 [Dreissena polymorpha]|uniref:Uncharacterized protein n=1 Tax=Dreissena polymorpha TaxID=45954 RepID=A0A9D4CND9_DREPO|nr:hypothetical protein DPMN_053462 [Dreissena polymorpha]
MKSHDDKSVVLKKKSCLKQNTQYSNVFISSDRSREERVQANNFRKILDGLKSGQVSNLEMRGAYVVSKMIVLIKVMQTTILEDLKMSFETVLDQMRQMVPILMFKTVIDKKHWWANVLPQVK